MNSPVVSQPFITCEVTCGAGNLDVADRQNAHSMTVAIKGVDKLYTAVEREKEGKFLAFSISHDYRLISIYIAITLSWRKNKTIYYFHPIYEFGFIALDDKDELTTFLLFGLPVAYPLRPRTYNACITSLCVYGW